MYLFCLFLMFCRVWFDFRFFFFIIISRVWEACKLVCCNCENWFVQIAISVSFQLICSSICFASENYSYKEFQEKNTFDLNERGW